MLRFVFALNVLAFSLLAPCAHAADSRSDLYVVRHQSWSDADEQGWRDFVAAIGASDCTTLDACLHGKANPFAGTDRPGYVFQSDCADLPYVLRFYYAWKRGLPFSYVSDVRARGTARDIRYSPGGNAVSARTDVPSGINGYQAIENIRDAVSSATYRLHPDMDDGDFYSPRLSPDAIRPGTVVYDPAGHVGIVYKVEANGRIRFFDSHTDYSLTETVYDLRFAREKPAVGAGFKNWRPQHLEGGHVVLARNADIADFSDEQFTGNGARPRDEDWQSGTFTLNGEPLDYYDYLRARMAGGKLVFEPVAELTATVWSNCSDLHYRAQAVQLAVAAGLPRRAQPQRLPDNIYGTEGDWETYSTPSRDARLKTAFKALRDNAQRFVEMARRHDPHVHYDGDDIVHDLLKAYDRATSFCRIATGAGTLTYEDARKLLFAMSFDPYHCVERRWGGACDDGAVKDAWYEAEQNLRNQIERTYDARMGFTLEELRALPQIAAPDTDVRAYLLSQASDVPPSP
jgi:hypothetical protein